MIYKGSGFKKWWEDFRRSDMEVLEFILKREYMVEYSFCEEGSIVDGDQFKTKKEAFAYIKGVKSGACKEDRKKLNYRILRAKLTFENMRLIYTGWGEMLHCTEYVNTNPEIMFAEP